MFLLSLLAIVASFILISELLLWSYGNVRDWLEIPEPEIWESRNIWRLGWVESRISLMKCYWILQNTRVAAFTVSELIKESQHGLGGGEGVGGKITTHTQNRVNIYLWFCRRAQRSRRETRRRRRSRTIYECCRGYRQEGDQCPIGESQTEEIVSQIYS